VLGGVDSARIIPNNVKFAWYQDDETPFMLDLNRILVRGLANDTTNFLDIDVAAQTRELSNSPASSSTGVTTNIDSNQPFLYLPVPTCNKIAEAFGLYWDKNDIRSEYIIPEATHKLLVQRNASMTLFLNPRGNNKEFVNITLTYESLNFYNGFPYGYPNKLGTRYFPMRPTNTTPVLGRAFLQDAYLYANYDKKQFHVSQVDWASTLAEKTNIQETYPYSYSKTHGLSKVAIAGIAAGIAALALIITLVWFMCRRSRLKKRAQLETILEE